MKKRIKITERSKSFRGDYWTVEVDGVVYRVARERGRAIRIPYKPRGENIGYHWHGSVSNREKGSLWAGKIGKSTGPYKMLWYAEVIDQEDYPRLGQKPGEDPRDYL